MCCWSAPPNVHQGTCRFPQRSECIFLRFFEGQALALQSIIKHSIDLPNHKFTNHHVFSSLPSPNHHMQVLESYEMPYRFAALLCTSTPYRRLSTLRFSTKGKSNLGDCQLRRICRTQDVHKTTLQLICTGQKNQHAYLWLQSQSHPK